MTHNQIAMLIHLALIAGQFLLPDFMPGLNQVQRNDIHLVLGLFQGVLGYGQSKMDNISGNFDTSAKNQQ